MFVLIPGVLPREVAFGLRDAAIAWQSFDRARSTLQKGALFIDEGSDLMRRCREALHAVRDDPEFLTSVYPAATGVPSLCLYETGMESDGDLPALEGIRNDVAVVVNLSDENEYEGGEVVLDVGGIEKHWRGALGDGIAFSADGQRRVARIESGRRLLLTFAIQSFVRDAAKRRVLADFSIVLRSFERQARSGAHVDLLRRTRDSLLRRWAENAPTLIA